jgi:hypothetical protein
MHVVPWQQPPQVAPLQTPESGHVLPWQPPAIALQRPSWHTWLAPQTWQAAPALPQAAIESPTWHCPVSSQQPLGHMLELHGAPDVQPAADSKRTRRAAHCAGLVAGMARDNGATAVPISQTGGVVCFP